MEWTYSELCAPLPNPMGEPVDHTRPQYHYWYTYDEDGKQIARVYCIGGGEFFVNALWPMKGTQPSTLWLYNSDVELAKAEADGLLASMGWEVGYA